MKKSRGIAVLLLTAIVTVFFCYVAAVGIGPTGTGSAKNINTGLDLAGGVSITYQAKDSNPSKEDMSDTVYKMQQRVSQYSTEAQAYQEGSNRITIEIPGVSDANAILEELGKPGSLYFIDQTDADGNKNFTTGNSESGYVLARSIRPASPLSYFRTICGVHCSRADRRPENGIRRDLSCSSDTHRDCRRVAPR